MASSIRRSRRKSAGIVPDSNLCNFSPKLLRFCKVIFNPRSHRLKIPIEFARRYGVDLPKRVYLRAPVGPEFEVELISSNGETWLQKGWDDFKKYYSLDFGHFLVFQYDMDSYNFHVLIFDMTASEIEYPPDRPGNVIKADYISDDDDSCRILKQPFTKRKGKGKISDEYCDNQTESKVYAEVLLNNPRKRRKGEKAIEKNTSIVYQRAKAFKSANPHFISLMQPSYVSGVFTLAVPASFVKNNMPSNSNKIKLRIPDGKVWAVKCSVHGPNGRINCGWKQFVEDNGLKVGDVCVFEMSKRSKFVWNITIFRC